MTVGGDIHCKCGLVHATYDPYEMNKVTLLFEFERMKAERDIYRSYYLASEEGFRLGETVGVTKEEWARHDKEYREAIDACEKLEKNDG